MILDVSGKVSLSPSRFHKVSALALKLLKMVASNRRFVPFSVVRSFLGVAGSCYLAVPQARIRTFNLYTALHQYMRLYRTVPGFTPKSGLPGHRIKLNKSAQRDLKFWASLKMTDCYSFLAPPANHVKLVTDASLDQWAAVLYRDGTTLVA